MEKEGGEREVERERGGQRERESGIYRLSPMSPKTERKKAAPQPGLEANRHYIRGSLSTEGEGQ